MKSTNRNFIRRLQSGKEDALEYIVDRYMPLLKNVVRHVLGPIGREELIGECVNDVFLSIWQNARKFRGSDADSFKNWICAVAKYKAIDIYRKEVKNTEIPAEFVELLPPDAPTGEVLAEDRVNQLLNQLDKVDRQIFIMRYLLGFHPAEIAEVLDLSKSAVDNRIYRGKKKLRDDRRFSYEGHL
ncbi:sigma-70 family RNA polymerase sigma factor [Sporosarcina cyprini]|uniref:sigma-70 family RNA polymerase sigma factor n=1 Tax=Sporosarcina cyprini TaxID=2910523 RepID=UPI001EDDE26C|nr:sigma-70 family RNA polymerase sigma factor [Sporosarcina cyprini]MCG3087285.1 sigma-70 family RNA polymerase sigma factor [Sporosarcina cyprini]